MGEKELILSYKARYAKFVSDCFSMSKKDDLPTYRQIFVWHLANYEIKPYRIHQILGAPFNYATVAYSIKTITNRLNTEKNFSTIFKDAFDYDVEASAVKTLIYTNEAGFESEVNCKISHVGLEYTLYHVEGKERVIKNSKIIDMV